MRIGTAAVIWALAALALPTPVPAAAVPPGRIGARPSAQAPAALPTGVTELRYGAFAYRPASAGKAPLPLLVLFHGAGGSARRLLEQFRGVADRRGYALLSLQSQAVTWDLIVDAGRKRDSKDAPSFGADVARSDQLIGDLFRKLPIDSRRIAAVGFSDGASYALSLGLANPHLFTGVIALSPGFFTAPTQFEVRQRIFIAHGRRDEILPFANAQRIAKLLDSTGVAVQFRPFHGPHAIDRAVLDEGLVFVAGA